MDQLKAPEKLIFDAPDLAHTWKKWKEEFSLYADLAMEDKDEKLKVKMFKYLIGARGREVMTLCPLWKKRTIELLKY